MANNKEVKETNASEVEKRINVFKKAYLKGETWGDAEKVVALLSRQEIIDLTNALVLIKAYMGIDMRKEFFLGILKSEFVRGVA